MLQLLDPISFLKSSLFAVWARSVFILARKSSIYDSDCVLKCFWSRRSFYALGLKSMKVIWQAEESNADEARRKCDRISLFWLPIPILEAKLSSWGIFEGWKKFKHVWLLQRHLKTFLRFRNKIQIFLSNASFTLTIYICYISICINFHIILFVRGFPWLVHLNIILKHLSP